MKDYLKITNEDNMELMARYPDNHFDLAIVDPPYGISINANMGRKKGKRKKHDDVKWDNEIPQESFFDELKRVSENQIVWGGNYFGCLWGDGCKHFIFWDKIVPADLSFSDGELAWTSFDGAIRKLSLRNTGGGKIHPTQKPVKLYEWLLSKYAKEGDKILDTHLGSGSIAIAVDYMNKIEKMNLTLTACELDKDYYESAIKRIELQTNQMTIF